MSLPKNNFQIKSQYDGDGDGYWEIANEKGSLRTTEDYEGVEDDLQKIADMLNGFPGKLTVQTDLELTLHCDHQMAEWALKQEKERSMKLVEALQEIAKYKQISDGWSAKMAADALSQFHNTETKKS